MKKMSWHGQLLAPDQGLAQTLPLFVYFWLSHVVTDKNKPLCAHGKCIAVNGLYPRTVLVHVLYLQNSHAGNCRGGNVSVLGQQTDTDIQLIISWVATQRDILAAVISARDCGCQSRCTRYCYMLHFIWTLFFNEAKWKGSYLRLCLMFLIII